MRKLKNNELNRISVAEFKTTQKTPLIVVLDNIRSLNNIESIQLAFLFLLLYSVLACRLFQQISKIHWHISLLIFQQECRNTLHSLSPKQERIQNHKGRIFFYCFFSSTKILYKTGLLGVASFSKGAIIKFNKYSPSKTAFGT